MVIDRKIMRITPSDIVKEFQEIYTSNDSERSKPNRYRSVLEILIRYLLDIPIEHEHTTAYLVSHVHRYFGAHQLKLPARTRRLNRYFNKWSHANSSEFDIVEFREIESEFKSLIEEVLEVSISSGIPNNKKANSFKQDIDEPSFKMTKTEVLEFIEQQIGQGIVNKRNFKYSNINRASGAFWLNIPPEKFEEHLDIGLIDRQHVIWIRITGGSISNPSEVFATRNDNGMIDLRIEPFNSEKFLLDTLANFDFKPFAKIFSRNE